ncbi:MAG: VanZ family protein [Patescibacteria group bacterium]
MDSKRYWIILLLLHLVILAAIIAGAYLGFIPTEIAYIPFYDFIGHFVLLGILSYLLHRSLNRKHFARVPAAPLLVTGLAIIEEFTQLMSSIRAFSFLDMFANVIGIWTAYFIDVLSVKKLGSKIKSKIIITGIVVGIVVVTTVALIKAGDYLLYGNLDREQLQEVIHQDRVFRVFDEEPPTSFNSGHKVLSLYSNKGKLLDEVKYGDHPLIIELINENTIHLLIPITFYERDNIEDINSRIDRNNSIGDYGIEHRIFEDPATSTKDFKYPR